MKGSGLVDNAKGSIQNQIVPLATPVGLKKFFCTHVSSGSFSPGWDLFYLTISIIYYTFQRFARNLLVFATRLLCKISCKKGIVINLSAFETYLLDKGPIRTLLLYHQPALILTQGPQNEKPQRTVRATQKDHTNYD